MWRYRSDAPKGQETSLLRSTPLKGFKTSDLVTKRVAYNSKDGTSIPMSIIHHKDFKQDGTAPGLQYGYVSTAVLASISSSHVQSWQLHQLNRGLRLLLIVGRFREHYKAFLLGKASYFYYSLRGCGCCDKYQRGWRVRWRMARWRNVSTQWISGALSPWLHPRTDNLHIAAFKTNRTYLMIFSGQQSTSSPTDMLRLQKWLFTDAGTVDFWSAHV